MEYAFEIHTSPSSWLQTLLMTGNLRGEVVTVSFASTIVELFASLRFRVEEPPGEVAFTGTRFLGLLAWIDLE